MSTSAHAAVVDWTAVDAVLFDLDGVITPTAEVHMHAWAEMFTPYLAGKGVAPYTEADYFAHVDGRPRYDGVAALLADRGLAVPYGDPGDDPATESVCGLGNRKNLAFGEVLARDGVQAYPGSVALLDALEDRGIRMAIVSSSANAPGRAACRRAPGALRDGGGRPGREAAGAPGKPDPGTYEFAADVLGVQHPRAVVVEDAVSGVRAGAAGDFAFVVGVDRGAGAATLTEHGADVVVDDLAELVGPVEQVDPGRPGARGGARGGAREAGS